MTVGERRLSPPRATETIVRCVISGSPQNVPVLWGDVRVVGEKPEGKEGVVSFRVSDVHFVEKEINLGLCGRDEKIALKETRSLN